MQRLGELYPRQHQYFFDKYCINYKKNDTLSIYAAFLEGIDLCSRQYISSWKTRVNRLLSWLNTVAIDLSTQPLEWQKLYEASVRSINEQPLAPYYLVSTYFLGVSIFLKLTKDQYFKVLAFFVNFTWVFRKVDFYADMLNLEIISCIDDTEDERFHLVFPQVFTAFSLVEWDPVKDFYIGLYTLEIRKVYFSKLFVKHYDFLKTETSFFKDFPEVQQLACTENAMLTYLNSLDTQDHDIIDTIWHFMCYLEPLDMSYASIK